MGALTYEPAQSLALARTVVDLSLLARDMRTVLAGGDMATLQQVVLLGGATHGTQPKVLAHYDMKGNVVSARAMRGYAPWIFKFPAQGQHKEVCAMEALYADLARICGLDVPDSRHFDLGDGLAAYGAARFDMEGGMRVPVHTLAGPCMRIFASRHQWITRHTCVQHACLPATNARSRRHTSEWCSTCCSTIATTTARTSRFASDQTCNGDLRHAMV